MLILLTHNYFYRPLTR